MSISPRSGAEGDPKIGVLKLESRFTVGLNATKNIAYIQKCFE